MSILYYYKIIKIVASIPCLCLRYLFYSCFFFFLTGEVSLRIQRQGPSDFPSPKSIAWKRRVTLSYRWTPSLKGKTALKNNGCLTNYLGNTAGAADGCPSSDKSILFCRMIILRGTPGSL